MGVALTVGKRQQKREQRTGVGTLHVPVIPVDLNHVIYHVNIDQSMQGKGYPERRTK